MVLRSWRFWARKNQLPPDGNWRTWLILAGRGFGKTRTGGETVTEFIRERGYRYIALVGRTLDDARKVMIEGPSGLLARAPTDFYPTWEPGKRKITWPNGAVGYTYSADKPDQLRGPENDLGWLDEAASWQTRDAWDQFSFGLRIPHADGARAIITTTPRPKKWLRELIDDSSTFVTRGRTLENQRNLDPKQLADLLKRYGGTTLGRQELDAELFDEAPGALWLRRTIDEHRRDRAPDLVRIIVAIDPAITAEEDSNETGIVVAGVDEHQHGYALEDLSGIFAPDEWGQRAVKAMRRWGADRIIAEVNQGGDMVEHVIRTIDPNAPFTAVHATRGKRTRAEPAAALYEQGRVHHVRHDERRLPCEEAERHLALSDLEDQLCGWAPGEPSPDRLDALVWALHALVIDSGYVPPVSAGHRTRVRASGVYGS